MVKDIFKNFYHCILEALYEIGKVLLMKKVVLYFSMMFIWLYLAHLTQTYKYNK